MESNTTKDEVIEVMERDWSIARSFSKYADKLHKKATEAKRAARAAATSGAGDNEANISANISAQQDVPPTNVIRV